MFQALLDWTARIRRDHPFTPGHVLEIGSYDVNGNPRHLFADAASYTGYDRRPGPQVDTTDLPQHPFNTILCYETLEHDPKFWDTLDYIDWALIPSGILILTTPTFGFPLHRHPKDYYRFGEDFYREVAFANYDLLDLSTANDASGFECLCGLGRKRR